MEAEMKEMDEKLGKTLSWKMIILMKRSQSRLEKERTTEAYKEKMNKDIENIDKNENSKK